MIGTLPLFCWYDWKYREIPDNAMCVLFIITAPFLLWVYANGIFGWEEAVTSGLTVVTYYAITRFSNRFFHGDDFIYMSIVSLCCVVNPLMPDSGSYAVKVLIYLGGVLVVITALNFLWNVAKAWIARWDELSPPTEIPPLMDMINGFDRGFPMMFAFAPAMILALVI